MDQADLNFHLLRFSLRHNATDSLQHCKGWIREERPTYFDRKFVCVLGIADQLIPSFATLETFQSTRFTSKFLCHCETYKVLTNFLRYRNTS